MTLAHYSNIIRGHLYNRHNKSAREAREIVQRDTRFISGELAKMTHPSMAASLLLVRNGFSRNPVA